MQAGVVAVGALGGLELGHPPHRGAEVEVLDEVGELDPRVDLSGLGVIGQLGSHAPQQRHEFGVGVETAEHLVEEVVDQPLSFGLGHGAAAPFRTPVRHVWCLVTKARRGSGL